MKYGVHCYLFTDHWADDQLGILDAAQTLGAAVVEIAIGDDVHFTPELTRRRAMELGLQLTTGPGGEWPLHCDLSSERLEDRQKGLAWHKRQVDLTAEIGGIAYTGALYGHPGVVKRRVPPEEEFSIIAEGLHQLGDYAARQGVKIVLEPMSHFRTHLVNTPEQAMRLLTLADHPNLYVLLDTYHLVTEIRDFAQAIRTVQSRLWGLHACENDRGVPGGGLVPWPLIFETLREINFDGYLLLETYNTGIGDFAYRRGIFQNLCPDGREFAQTGLTFLREQERTCKRQA